MIKDFLRIITATLILPSYLLNANDEEINDEEVREVDEVIVEEQLEVCLLYTSDAATTHDV